MSDPLIELRDALARIEPSSGFEQRTQRAIAAAPRVRGFSQWQWAAVAACVVIASGVVLWRANDARVPAPRERVATTAPQPSPSPVSERAVVSSTTPVQVAPAPVLRAVDRDDWVAPATADADQAVAMRRLMQRIQAGRVVVPPDSLRTDDIGPLAGPNLVELAPIVIAPVSMPVIGQGGGEKK